MPMVPFNGKTASAIASAGGVATATIGPIGLGQTWTVLRTALTSTSTVRTTATIYRNAVSPGNFVDQSRGGGNGDVTGTAYKLQSGESVIVQWTGCTAGATCIVTVDGQLEQVDY